MQLRRRGNRGGRAGGRPIREKATTTVANRRPTFSPYRSRGTRGGRGRGIVSRERPSTTGRGTPVKRPFASKTGFVSARGRGRGRVPFAGRGIDKRRGRGRSRGRGRTDTSRQAIAQKKGLSGAQLDKDLEEYFKSDPEFSERKLDTEMEEYWSHRPADEEGAMDADAA